jgi:hypothetical protein
VIAAGLARGKRDANNCVRDRNYLISKEFDFDGVKVGPSGGSSSEPWPGSRNRRLARDLERYATTVAAFIRLALIRIMLRRLTRPTLCP